MDSSNRFYMIKSFLITILFFTSNISGFSQENKTDPIDTTDFNYIFLPSQDLYSRINASLRAREALIRLRTHPLMNLINDQFAYYSRLVDTIQNIDNVVIEDSVSITLKSGISWNIIGDPPPAPPNFYLKAINKKGREDKAVGDRIKYLQFCQKFKEQEDEPYEMIDKFNSYYAIYIDRVKYFEMYFEIRFDEEGKTKITNREIIIGDYFSGNKTTN